MRPPTMTSIDLDPQRDSMLRSPMEPLHESSKEGVVRKAVALMKRAVEVAGSDRYFILQNSKDEKTRIWLD